MSFFFLSPRSFSVTFWGDLCMEKVSPCMQVAHATESSNKQKNKAFIFIVSERGPCWISFRHTRKTFI